MSTPGSPPAKPYRRRSARIPRRLSIVLRSRDPQGNLKDEPAETILLSQHGCMLTCRVAYKLGEELLVQWSETKREARARIVWREMGGAGGLVQLGMEFIDVENFWGIDFPPDTPSWSPFAR